MVMMAKIIRNRVKIFIIIVALVTMIFAVKPYYGGEVTIRLNEPSNFIFTPSDYSNMVFYSLLYENFFYLKSNGEIFSNIFNYYKYDKTSRALVLDLKDNLSFSNGDPIDARSVKLSLKLFLDMKAEISLKLRHFIKSIKTEENRIILQLMYDNPDIISLLTTPELVLLSGTDGIFSGMFYPVKWGENRYIKLAPNKYYPGGRTYLDGVKVVFYDYYYPDIFLSKPGHIESGYREFNAGVYQNIYLGFPHGKVGTNTRIALYSLLKEFAKSIEMTPLNVLTSDEESPVTLNIRSFSNWKVRSILRRSRITLYILSSLKEIEEKLGAFLTRKGLRLETIYLSDNELTHFIDNIEINYLLMVKVFNKRMPIEEKIKRIIREMSFTRFNETYLKLINELEEVQFLKDEELLINQVSKLIEKIVKDGFLLPLYQNRYSLYIKNEVRGIEVDYYGRPLFQRMRMKMGAAAQLPGIEHSPEQEQKRVNGVDGVDSGDR
jgi:MarR-like DNA-binding transcriptional regulator SgrR of sgrS sRNA